jgi:serine/threonine protein phosphatase PrpC
MIGIPRVIEYCGLTDAGSVRKNNEDNFRLEPDRGLWIIADGMGGAQAGEHASHLAVDAVVDYLMDSPAASAAANSGALEDAFLYANRSVLQAARADGRFEGMGTTLLAAMVSGSDLLIASVGDSRAYALSGQSRLKVLTQDQSWVNEIGRIQLGLSEEALRRHPMRHVLTMAVGVGEHLRVNSYRYPLEPGMQILLCSDGLHGVIGEAAMERVLQSDWALDRKCTELVRLANESGGPDNITVIVLKPNF